MAGDRSQTAFLATKSIPEPGPKDFSACGPILIGKIRGVLEDPGDSLGTRLKGRDIVLGGDLSLNRQNLSWAITQQMKQIIES